jgi:hypothetical protein
MISKGTFLTNTKTFALLPPIYCARMVGDRWQIIAPDESPYAPAYRCVNVADGSAEKAWRSNPAPLAIEAAIKPNSSGALTRFARERLFKLMTLSRWNITGFRKSEAVLPFCLCDGRN